MKINRMIGCLLAYCLVACFGPVHAAGGMVEGPNVVAPDRALGVPGPTRQPPPEKGMPSPMSDFIANGEWGPGFNAQNEMLDEHMKKYNLQEVDWRPGRPWYKPSK